MKKHFVTFYSAGTITAETTTKEIDSWDVDKAIEISKDIIERYGETPYAFRFSTRERTSKDLDSKITKRSGNYYLGGKLKTFEQIKEEKNPINDILLSNMECNNWKKVITTKTGWTMPLLEEDIVLSIK